jgi:galactokinase
LIGEHTDYSGGLVLAAATQLGLTLEIESPADTVCLTSALAGAARPFRPDGGGPRASGWARYAQAVAGELAVLGRPPVGLVGSISSTLPAGAGLSSSAALEVAVGLALCEVAGWRVEPLALALACQRAELRAVGVPCGILDQATSILAEEGAAMLLDCSTLEYRSVAVPEEIALVVVDSGVERNLEHTAYATRRAELEDALRAIGSTRSTTIAPSDLDGLEGVPSRRLRHVVTENDRVRQFAVALEAHDLVQAGKLLFASHASLRDDYEVSIPELDLLVSIAGSSGAYGARLLGAGFGGWVLVLADRERAADLAREIADRYREDTGKGGRTMIVQASAGAAIHRG